MRRSKPRGLSTSSKTPSLKAGSRSQLKQLQEVMATALFRPLTAEDRMQRTWVDGRAMSKVAESFIKPNDRLSSFERLEIYNRVYWFRVLDCLYDDYPGLRAVLGERKVHEADHGLSHEISFRVVHPPQSWKSAGEIHPGRTEMGLSTPVSCARYGAIRMGPGCRFR